MNRYTTLLAALLLTGYGLPWVTVPTIGGFTNSAYDLAEWVSIHPAIRSDPFLVTPLLLRLPLVAMAVYIAVSSERRSTIWARLIGVALIGIALLPPWEFFSGAFGDTNYQQSFLLGVSALTLGMAGLYVAGHRNSRLTLAARVGSLILGVAAGAIGLSSALPVLQSLGLGVQPGFGVMMYGAVNVLAIGNAIRTQSPIRSRK